MIRALTPAPCRILLIRPSALGDVCRSVPLAVSLRAHWPDARISWLVQDAFAPAVARHPCVDEVIPFDRKGMGRAAARGNLGPTLAFLRGLHCRRFDLVIDAQGLARSGLFAWATGARRRVGLANARELGWLFLNERHRVPASDHSVDRMLGLIGSAGIEPIPDMRLAADPAELAWVDAQGLGRFAVLAPTSRWPAKQWPADRFAELARRLLARGVPRVVIVGGPGEEQQIGPLLGLERREARVTTLVGQTSIARLMAVIARAGLVVANDSAAAHMAVGFDRPLVALYGPTDVSLVGPYRRDADVIQHVTNRDRLEHKDPAGVELMQRIGVDEVARACRERWR